MSEKPEQVEHFFNAEYYREKLKQENCNSHKKLLEERIRFLKALSDELDAVEEVLSNLHGDEQPSGSEPDMEHEDKLKGAIERVCECEDSVADKIENSAELLKVIMIQCENVAGEIEEISNQICDIRNGEEVGCSGTEEG